MMVGELGRPSSPRDRVPGKLVFPGSCVPSLGLRRLGCLQWLVAARAGTVI